MCSCSALISFDLVARSSLTLDNSATSAVVAGAIKGLSEILSNAPISSLPLPGSA